MRQTFIGEETTVTTSSMNKVQQTTAATRCECKVCGALARYSHNGAVICQSCKVFFRRNAEHKQAILKCRFDNKCEISILNRHTCACCRLKKCFVNKMRIEMTRASRSITF